MKRIYLIRHGESEWNILHKIQGQKNVPLTEHGREQARQLGNRLINENIDIIYSSDLSRALETATTISKLMRKPAIKAKEIREINFGPWEGLTIEEIKQKHRQDYCTWLKEPDKLKLEGGETLAMLEERVMEFMDNVLNNNNSKNIAIVSHSATLKVIILNLLGMGNSFYKNITLKNVSVSIIERRDYNNVLTLLNDTSHLKGF
ncbi:MAG: histidine phosphatase family protein [Tissierellaceae bacterium]